MAAETSIAISIASLTLFLLIATIYYAIQTGLMVREMRRQRTEAAELERDRYRRQIQGIRNTVIAEIRQIMQWDRGERGKGRLYVWLSSSAWRASQQHSEAFPVEIRDRLIRFYDEVARMNGVLLLMILSHVQTEHDQQALGYISPMFGEERATWPEFMLREIAGVIEEIEALPAPA